MNSLAQSLAIDSQIGLPGSAGRLAQQIRDIESVAPLFRDAGLIKPVARPAEVNMSVSGIATRSCIKRALGGFLFASAGVRTDMLIEQNRLSTRGSDSVSALDDIDFEAQRKRLDLIEMRHGYELVERLLDDRHNQAIPSQLLLLDTPLFISREMAPLARNAKHVEEYQRTRDCIARFWEHRRQQLFPWCADGPLLVSILAERYSAIISIARQDLRTEAGRAHLLLADGFDAERAAKLQQLEQRLAGIGDQRFIHGILGGFSRTMAFRIASEQARMEPADAVAAGLVGFHFRGGRSSQIQLAQLAGEQDDWNSAQLDEVAWRLMVLDMQHRSHGQPLPQLLGQQQLRILDQFAAYYQRGLSEALRTADIEKTWLSGLDIDD